MALGIKFRSVCLQRHTLCRLSHLSRLKHAYRDDTLRISQGSSSQNLRVYSVNSKCYPFLEHLRNSFIPDHFAFSIYSVFWHPAIERFRLIVSQMSLWGYCQECCLYSTLSFSGRPKGGILYGLHHQEKLSSAFLLTTSLLLTWLSPITNSLLLVTVYFTISLFGLL